jgi:hypothetical protein
MEEQPQNLAPIEGHPTILSRRKAIIFISIIVLAIILIAGGYFYYIKIVNKTAKPFTNEQVISLKKIKIISPQQGIIVKPGEIINIKVQLPQGVVSSKGIFLSSSVAFLEDKTPPYEFEVKIPENQDLGPLYFFVIDKDAFDKENIDNSKKSVNTSSSIVANLESQSISESAKSISEFEFADEITVYVEVPEKLVSFNVDPSEITLANAYSPSDTHSQKALRVKGVFADNQQRDITLSSKIKYSSHDESIASISIGNPGSSKDWPLVRGLKAGETFIIVSYEGKSVDIPVVIQSSNVQPVAKILPEDIGMGSFEDYPPVKVGTIVTLDGTKSYDPNGDTITFEWWLDLKPDGSKAIIIDSDKVIAHIVPDKPGFYTGGLTVKDNRGGVDTDALAFTAAPDISSTKSTLSVSSPRILADGKTKGYITATIRGEDGSPVAGVPLALLKRLGGAKGIISPWEAYFCKEFETDSKGQVVFEVFTEAAWGAVDFIVEAGGCGGLKIEQKATIDFYH